MKIDLNVSMKANSGVALNVELGATGESDTGAAESCACVRFMSPKEQVSDKELVVMHGSKV